MNRVPALVFPLQPFVSDRLTAVIEKMDLNGKLYFN